MNEPAAPDGMNLYRVPVLERDASLFLDIDGTLLELAERPDAVRADAEVKNILRRLLVAAGGAVALISGRSVADVDRLFAPQRFAVAGQHGIERRDAGGRLHIHPAPMARLRAAAARLEKAVEPYPDLVFENKGASLALHFRRAPNLRTYVEVTMRGLLDELGDEFELQQGKMLIEIKPGGKDKGTAITEFMNEPPFRQRTPVFIGDDLTDEFGFAIVNDLGGHSVKVGGGPSQARWRLPDARAVRAWLSEFADRSLNGNHP